MWSEMRARDPKLTRAPDPNSARRNQKERRILCVRADRGRGTFCAWRAARPPSKYARDFRPRLSSVRIYAARMEKPLEPGDELHCPHCRRWHTVISRHSDGYTKQMMYFTCRQAYYYAGQVGAPSRHPTRPAAVFRLIQ